jgi:hypothetical protein
MILTGVVMKPKEFWTRLGTRFLFVLLLLPPVRTFAQRSVQSPQCAGVIQGVVSDNQGQAVRGIKVVAWPLGVELGVMLPNVRTDETGKYRFEELCPNRYTVLPDDEKRGYPNISPWLFEFLYGRRVSEVRLTAKQVSAELPVHLPPKPGRIHVRVTDRTTNAEVQKFAIRMIVPRQRHTPKIEILFSPEISDREITVPPDKDFVLRINADGFHEWSDSVGGYQSIHVEAGAQTMLDAQLEPLK